MNLHSPEKLFEKLPLNSRLQQVIHSHRVTIQNLLNGKDPRLALVFGPCSIHDLSSTLEYARRFKALAEEVSATCYCVMRVYIEKPRTTAGWKGLVYDPYLDGSGDLQTGIYWGRELFLTLTELGIPIATEILHPMLVPFFSDLISWGFIGARTSASQPHRELASYLPLPVGFKNSLEGVVQPAIQGMISARQPHTFPFLSQQGILEAIASKGNPWTHVVLRGSLCSPNYDSETLQQTSAELLSHGFKHRILIDCSHGNCSKRYAKQPEVFTSVLEQFMKPLSPILGMMLESYLEEGSQFLSESPSSLHYGVSITDPCIGWETTEFLVRKAAEELASCGKLIS